MRVVMRRWRWSSVSTRLSVAVRLLLSSQKPLDAAVRQVVINQRTLPPAARQRRRPNAAVVRQINAASPPPRRRTIRMIENYWSCQLRKNEVKKQATVILRPTIIAHNRYCKSFFYGCRSWY